MSARSTVLAAALVLVGSACDTPLFDSNCSADRIVARFDGTFTLDGTEQQLGREDAVAATNLEPPVFRQLNDVLLEGSASASGAVWSHGGIGSANDFFALAVATPLQDGQVRAVTSAFQGGGWGLWRSLPGVPYSPSASMACGPPRWRARSRSWTGHPSCWRWSWRSRCPTGSRERCRGRTCSAMSVGRVRTQGGEQ